MGLVYILIVYEDEDSDYREDYLEYVIEDIHFFLFLSLCWVRSNLLYWAWGSLKKLCGFGLPGVGKCSLHLS